MGGGGADVGLEKAKSRWELFWRAPTDRACSALCSHPAALARLFDASKGRSPAGEDESAPAPPPASFAMLVALAVADPRRTYRKEPGEALPGWLEALGDAGDTWGPSGAASKRARWACRAWDAAMEGGAKPEGEDLRRAALFVFSTFWRQPEWVEPRKPKELDVGAWLFVRLLRAAEAVAPGGGSDMARMFVAGADARNHSMAKAGKLFHPDVAKLWDPLHAGPDGEPLWRAMLDAETRLGSLLRSGLAKRLWSAGSGPLATDPALAHEFLGACGSFGEVELFRGEAPADEWGVAGLGSLALAFHRARGDALGPASKGLPDWMWLRSRHLTDFDQDPSEKLMKIISATGGSGTKGMRDDAFAQLRWLRGIGCDPSWTGPDGESALDAMRSARGYGALLSEWEASDIGRGVAAEQAIPSAGAALRI